MLECCVLPWSFRVPLVLTIRRSRGNPSPPRDPHRGTPPPQSVGIRNLKCRGEVMYPGGVHYAGCRVSESLPRYVPGQVRDVTFPVKFGTFLCRPDGTSIQSSPSCGISIFGFCITCTHYMYPSTGQGTCYLYGWKPGDGGGQLTK
jgi:hypothetical protein